MHLLAAHTTVDDLTPAVLDAVRGRAVTIDPSTVAVRDLPVLIDSAAAVGLVGVEAEHYERTRVALIVWRIVEDYVHTHQAIASTPDRSLAETAETFVATYSDDALGATDEYGHVIMASLDRLSVADDFFRMVRGDQADAFDLVGTTP